MNETYEFFMPMKKVPTATHQQKNTKVVRGKNPKDDKVVYFNPPNVVDAIRLFNTSLLPHIPDKMIEGEAVRLTTYWLFPTKVKKNVGKLKITRPDTDNSIKLLKDEMSKLKFWKDDALVAIDQIHKYWAEPGKSGIFVRIEVIEQ